jgi:hypothetical protein
MRLTMIAALLAQGGSSTAAPPGPDGSILGGLSGLLKPASGYTYAYGGLSQWVARVHGTACSLPVSQDFGTTTGLLEVSVDGGAFVSVDAVAGVATLFTGLADTAHTVCARVQATYADTYRFPTGAGLVVTSGASPAADYPTRWIQVGDGAADVRYGTLVEAHGYTGFVPALAPAGADVWGTNLASARFTANCTGLLIVTHAQRVHVSVSGGVPSMIDTGIADGASRAVYFPCTAGAQAYNVHADATAARYGSRLLSVGVLGTVSGTAAAMLAQFGDSITAGNTGSICGSVDTFEAAASLGMVGGTFGVGGQTTVGLHDRMDATLAGLDVRSGDVAIVAIGANDSAWTATQDTAYKGIVSKLLAKGFSKVLCRSLLRFQGDTFSSLRTGIEATVASIADARVKHISTATVTPSAGLHPDRAEYRVIAPQLAALYASALA